MRTIAGVVVALLGTGLMAGSGCSGPTAPDAPSWDVDVYPILRGSCLHCHGEAHQTASGPFFRFDVCNKSAPAFQMAGVSLGPTDAVTLVAMIVADLASPGGLRPKMPPPPGSLLSDYEAAVIRNWAALVEPSGGRPKPAPDVPCRKTNGNKRPTAALVGAVRRDGTTLVADFNIADPDGDPVFGKATAGGAKAAEFFASGRRTVRIEGATTDKVTLKLTDGYDVVDVTLP